MSIVTIERKVLAKNDEIADQNRHLLLDHSIFTINIVSSPGSGKTSILEKTIEYLNGKVKIGVIEGDVQTDLDAQRIARFGVPAVQIVTRGGCHLDATLVQKALQNLDLVSLQFLVIENVGNLVCPANYDLGEDLKVVVASTTEGDDKPLKYPEMFMNASVLLINKIDLLPYINCRMVELEKNALSVNPDLKIFRTSCTTGIGIPEWCDWIMKKVAGRR
jgi:hydrogenase nickel incorporation protein HypB